MKTEKNIGLSIFSYCLYSASSELRVKNIRNGTIFTETPVFKVTSKISLRFRLHVWRVAARMRRDFPNIIAVIYKCNHVNKHECFPALSNLTAVWTVSRGVHLSGRLSFAPRNDNSLREYPSRSRKGAGKAGINIQVVFTRETVLKGPLDRKLKEGFCTIRPYTSNDYSTTSSVLLV